MLISGFGLCQTFRWDSVGYNVPFPQSKVYELTNITPSGDVWKAKKKDDVYFLYKNDEEMDSIPYPIIDKYGFIDIVANDNQVYLGVNTLDSLFMILKYENGEYSNVYTIENKKYINYKLLIEENNIWYYITYNYRDRSLYKVVGYHEVNKISISENYLFGAVACYWHLDKNGNPFTAIANQHINYGIEYSDTLGGFFIYKNDSFIRIPFGVEVDQHYEYAIPNYIDSKRDYWAVSTDGMVKYDGISIEKFESPVPINAFDGVIIDEFDTHWFKNDDRFREVWNFSYKGNPLSMNEQELTNGEFELYPNPIGNTILLNTISENNLVQIFNSRGVVVYHRLVKSKNGKMDISMLKPGLYSLKLTNKENVRMKQFVKQ